MVETVAKSSVEILETVELLEQTITNDRDSLMKLLRATAQDLENDNYKNIKKITNDLGKRAKSIVDIGMEIRKCKKLSKDTKIVEQGQLEQKHMEEQALLEPTSQDAWTKTRKMFEDMLEGMRVNYEKGRRKYYNAVRTEAEGYVNETRGEMVKSLKEKYGRDCYSNPNSGAREVEQMIESTGGYYDAVMKIRKSIEFYIDSRIEEDIQAMFSAFISKNTRKIANIIKDRQLEVTGEFHNTRLECDLNFVLEDGARFHMKTQIVDKVSVNGLYFNQFPSTFSEAYKADGTKIVMPSEAKLKIQL